MVQGAFRTLGIGFMVFQSAIGNPQSAIEKGWGEFFNPKSEIEKVLDIRSSVI